jgi:PAS domain S-box-containing protein
LKKQSPKDKDKTKTKDQRIKELAKLRKQITKPGKSELQIKQKKLEIETLKKQMEFILGSTKTGLDIIDSEFNIRYIDTEWAKVYGDPTGRKCYEYFMGRNEVCPNCGIVKALETKSRSVTEEVLIKEGNRPIQVITIPFQNQEGEWLVAEVNMDITERKRIEEELRKARNDLEIHVEEQTKDLVKTIEELQSEIAKRKRTEKALHESEEFLQKILENAKEMIALHDLEGRILYYNGPVQYGLKSEDVVGKTIFDLINQEKAADIMGQIMQVVEKDEALNFTDNVSWKDKTFWVKYHRYPVKDKDGRIVAVGTIAHDITELKEAEKTLEESEERFRSVVQTATEAIITHDCDGNITFWNHGAENIYGYRPDEIMGKPFTLILPERFRKFHEKDLRNLVSSNVVLHRVVSQIPSIGLSKDGREFPTELSVSKWKTRKELFLTIIVRDITERRQAEEALHVSEERLRCLIRNAASVIVCLSPDHRVIEFNPEAERVFGCDWQEVIGKDYFELFLPEEVRGTMAENIKKVLAGGPIRGFEYPVLIADGRKRILSWYINRLTDTMDKPTGVIAIGQDVTCRKRAEDKISHLNHLYTMLTKVNETIVRVRQPEKLYEESCRIAVEDGLFMMAWVGLVDPDTGAIRPVAQRGFVGGYLDKIMASIGTDAPDGLDPVGTAIREGRHAVCDDFKTDPSMLPWREEGLKRGYRSAAAFPLRCGPHIVGSINFYAEGPHFFDNDVIGLLETLSNDISFALECFESERKREKTEQLMRESEERFRLIVENANDAIIMYNNRGEIVAWNRAAEDIFGYSAEETIGKPIAIIIPEQVHEGHQKAITITSKAVDENLHAFKKVKEMVGVRKDGGVITLEGSFSAWKAESDVFFTCILRDCSQFGKMGSNLYP